MKDALATLGLPADATRWLLELWNAIQVMDDVADGDPIERRDLDRAIFWMLAQIDPFFDRHRPMLAPVLANAVLKWKASDTIERQGMVDHLPKAYMLRAGYYDVIVQVYAICFGEAAAMENAHRVYALYGETLAEYLKEQSNA